MTRVGLFSFTKPVHDMKNDDGEAAIARGRERIQSVDRALIGLLKERMAAVENVAQVKVRRRGGAILDVEREAVVADSWAREADSQGLSGYFVRRVLREVLNESRRSQEPLAVMAAPRAGTDSKQRVGYQGQMGSHSELVARRLFPDLEAMGGRSLGYHSFEEVVSALEAGSIDYAVLPVENSIVGSIDGVNELLTTRDLSVVGEEVWDVEHCLAGLPGVTVEDVRSVLSHPVALGQCRGFLADELRAAAVECFDTAGAAETVASQSEPSVACLCSAEAAAHHGLRVLQRGVADHPHNKTRFLKVATQPEPCNPHEASKTALHFSVDDRCGALADVLTVFAASGVNLLRLESRPQPERPWEYLFLVDLEGHRESDNLRHALREVRRFTNHVRILGSYPSRAIEHLAVAAPVGGQQLAPLECAPPAACAPSSPKPAFHASGVPVGRGNFTLILGPCAVESAEQIRDAAAMVRASGAHLLRGGAFKPRSSPHSFQGLGFPGLDLLAEAGHAFELPVVTEVIQPDDVAAVAAKADVLQVGARSMQNFALLKQLGRSRRPVLLKRGMSATLKELLQAAEYIMDGGNQRVILCERGIRTFETATRSTLDISAIPALKSMTDLPIFVDPSHAAGARHLVVPLALAAAAAGADGLIVECHPRPDEALCDKEQALTRSDVDALTEQLIPILSAQGRSL